MSHVTPFLDRYNELIARFPDCPREYYHRAINEELGYCIHPAPLLQIGGPDGEYLFVLEDQMKGLRRWFGDPDSKASLWCPVCQTYPYQETPMKAIPLEMTPGVIDAINGELKYQTTLPEQGRSDNIDHGVEGRLLTLDVYTRKAIEAWVSNPGTDKALHGLRKVAAIAIRALEQYGCPRREGF